MKPKEVKRYRDIWKLTASGVDTCNSWILFTQANAIVIANQKAGCPSTGKVKLTRREFQKFVDWWGGKLK